MTDLCAVYRGPSKASRSAALALGSSAPLSYSTVRIHIIIIIFTANAFVPVDSGTTIRHNSHNNTHHVK
jgi:hypothetical protein